MEGGRAAAADAVECVMVLEFGDHALGVDHSPSVGTPDELLAFVADASPRPRDEGTPSNFTHTLLLRQLVEALDATDIRTALQTRIVEPLGLETTVFAATGTPLPDGIAAAWGQNGPLVGDPATPFEAVDSSLHVAISTASDLRVYLEALFAGDLISAESRTEMTTIDPDGQGLGVVAATLGPGGPAFGNGALTPGIERPGFGKSDFIIGSQLVWAIEPASGDMLVVLSNNDGPRDALDRVAGQVFTGWAEETSAGS